MNIVLLLLLVCLNTAIMIPIYTGEQRCMALYSLNEEDSLKVSVKFPADSSIQQYYDYVTEIRELAGNKITQSLAINYITRIEIIVPTQTIYEACIQIKPNNTKGSNQSHKYYGEILVEYQANTHFISDYTSVPKIQNALKESQILALQKQATQVINATKEYIRMQALQKQLEIRQFQQRREIEESLFEWWMVELLLIVSLGLYQWTKMKRKLQDGML